jgi:hypothetical protein
MDASTLANRLGTTLKALEASAGRLNDPALVGQVAVLHRQLNTAANLAVSGGLMTQADATDAGAAPGTPQPDDGGTPKNPA